MIYIPVGTKKIQSAYNMYFTDIFLKHSCCKIFFPQDEHTLECKFYHEGFMNQFYNALVILGYILGNVFIDSTLNAKVDVNTFLNVFS